ncbi:hypothetical protein EBR57_01730 [bacterium]|nr:hypothetical protein [bacterium]
MVFCLAVTPIFADLISVQLPQDTPSGFFYDVFYFGQTTSNALSKYSITGQKFWTVTPASVPIHDTQIAFNRLGFLDASGFIECRDTVFGIPLWRSEQGNFKKLLFQYPITYALSQSGDITAFDFNSGVVLYSGSIAMASGPITDILAGSNGEVIACTRSGIFQSDQELSKWTMLASTLPTGYRWIHRDGQSIFIASGNILAMTATQSIRPLLAMGLNSSSRHFDSGRLIALTPSSSTGTEWIISYPYLIEIAISFSLARIVDITTKETVLEWKEIDPDRSWRSVWWDNGLLAVVDQNQTLTVWDGQTRRTLGSVTWPDSDPPVGMIYTHDVLSFVSRTKIAYAFSRSPK